MNDITDFIEMMRRKVEQNSEPKLDHEVQVVRLKEAFLRYTRENPFKVGDWVTPIADVGLHGAGDPHIVIESRVRSETPPHMSGGECGSSVFGVRLDVRMLSIACGCIAAHWTESPTFEFWKGNKD